MRLLTWHGTILRVEQARNRLIHTAIMPARAASRDYALAVAAVPEAPMLLDGGVTLEPAGAGLVRLRLQARYLAASTARHFPAFDRAAADEADTLFLPLSEDAVAALRLLLAGKVRHGDAPGVFAAALEPEFMLRLGSTRLALREITLTATGPDRVALRHEGGVASLVVEVAEEAAEQGFALGDGAARLAEVADAAALAERAGPAGARLRVTGAEEIIAPPLVPDLATSTWLHAAGGQAWGRLRPGFDVLRQHGAAVVLAGPGAGLILGDSVLGDSVLGDGAVLRGGDPVPALPEGWARDGDTLFCPEDVLEAAPERAGPHVVLPEAAPPALALAMLHAMLPSLPAGVALLLPEAAWPVLGPLLAPAGLAAMAVTRSAAPLCRVESLYWCAAPGIEAVPAGLLRPEAPRAGSARFILHAAGGPAVSLAGGSAARLQAAGFAPLDLGRLAPGACAAAVAGAGLVIGVQAALAQVLPYLPAGCQVIELAAADGVPGGMAVLAQKFGLLPALVRCAWRGEALRPERGALGAMLSILEARA